MKRVLVTQLTPLQLDYLVGILEYPHLAWEDTIGLHWASRQIVIPELPDPDCYYHPSSDWNTGGKIVERENITVIRCDDDYGIDAEGFTTDQRISVWGATTGQHGTHTSYESEYYDPQYEISESDIVYGKTPLIAAMRCYVASQLGDMIEVPDELTD